MENTSTVLIVDDESSARKSLRALLMNQGYHLAFATNGLEALTMAAEQNPDIILLDVMMPDMDGLEVCQRLRATPDVAEVPIIMVTALDDRNFRLRAIEAGVDDFITKPFDRVELRARIKTITRLNRYRKLLTEKTQRREAEEKALSREQEVKLLQEIRRLQDEFISNASHELRTPLATITLLSGNLDTLYSRLNDADRLNLVQGIRKQTRALNELVAGILNISQIDQGRLSMMREAVNLAPLITEEWKRQRPLAEAKSHQIAIQNVEQLPVWGNPNQLQQIIRNLLSNAIKYTPSGGQISCEGQVHEVQDSRQSPDATWPDSKSLPPGRWVGFRVIDTGIGVAPQHQINLFDRFFRVHHQSTIPGTGLGLSIAKEMVELHQGHIAFVSEIGLGSTFAFYLPLLEPLPQRG